MTAAVRETAHQLTTLVQAAEAMVAVDAGDRMIIARLCALAVDHALSVEKALDNQLQQERAGMSDLAIIDARDDLRHVTNLLKGMRFIADSAAVGGT